MKLRDVRLTRASYELEQGISLDVRGLNVSDLMSLVTHYGPNLADAFQTIMPKARANTLTEEDLKSALLSAMRDAPDLVANMIALANDDYTPEGREAAHGLPLEHQIGILNVIVKETFRSEASVKKLIASLSESFLTISGALTGMNFPSRNGIGESDAK